MLSPHRCGVDDGKEEQRKTVFVPAQVSGLPQEQPGRRACAQSFENFIHRKFLSSGPSKNVGLLYHIIPKNGNDGKRN